MEWRGTAGKASTPASAGHERSFSWLPKKHSMLHSYNSCHPCMKSCVHLRHPTSSHSLTSSSSSAFRDALLCQFRHPHPASHCSQRGLRFSSAFRNSVAGTWLDGTRILAMTIYQMCQVLRLFHPTTHQKTLVLVPGP